MARAQVPFRWLWALVGAACGLFAVALVSPPPFNLSTGLVQYLERSTLVLTPPKDLCCDALADFVGNEKHDAKDDDDS